MKELRELAEKASKGEWHAWSDMPNAPRIRIGVSRQSPIEGCGYDSHCIALVRPEFEDADANGRFIAAANPQTVLGLLDRIEALEKDAERYRWLRDRLSIEDVEQLEREHWGETDEAESIKCDAAVDAAIEGANA
jgi:hypothetical protein